MEDCDRDIVAGLEGADRRGEETFEEGLRCCWGLKDFEGKRRCDEGTGLAS